jgi:hypothetical protein
MKLSLSLIKLDQVPKRLWSVKHVPDVRRQSISSQAVMNPRSMD